MLKNLIKYSALLGAFLFCSSLKAQYTQSSYSAFGIGEVNWGGYANNAAMGGMGISYNNRLFLNNINPALVATNYESVFQIGASLDSRSYTTRDLGSQENKSFSSLTGGFKDFGFSLPIKYGKWNMALGISPYTSVNYGLIQREPGPDETTTISQLIGEGGIDEVYLTNAFRIGRAFMVGVKASYLFGSIKKESEYLLDNTSTSFGSTFYNERRSFSDLTASVGVAYKLRVSDTKAVNLGGYYNLEANVRSRNFTKLESRNIGGVILSSDTLVNNVDSNVTIPQRLGFGISYEKFQKFVLGVDFHSQSWSQYLNEEGMTSAEFGDAFRIAVGGELIPNYQNAKLSSRITYRFGVHYEKTPYVINSREVEDFGINFGTSIPLNAFWGVSHVDLGLSFGKRGVPTNGMIRENYLKISIGFSLQDQTWFARQQYN